MTQKTKVVRIRLSTLNKIKIVIPPRNFESLVDYMDRVMEVVINGK